MDCYEELPKKNHPKDNSNFFSNVLFLYTVSEFRKGIRKKLEIDDLTDVPAGYNSKILGDGLEKNWEKQKRGCNNNLVILRVLFKTYGFHYITLGLFKVAANITILTFQPHAIGKIVYYFNPAQKDMSQQVAAMYGMGLILSQVMSSIVLNNYKLMVAGLGIKIRGAVDSLVLRKMLKLSLTNSDAFVGQAVTLITKDVYTIRAFIEFGNEIWIAFVSTVVVIVLLYIKIGVASLVTVGQLVVFGIIQIFGAVKINSFKKEVFKTSDSRYQILQEVLTSIRTVKMYAWESFFEDKITTARKKETYASQNVLITSFAVQVIFIFFWNINIVVTLTLYKLINHNASAEAVYYTMTCLRMLSLRITPDLTKGLSRAAELIPCLKRIQLFLNLPEQPNNKCNNSSCTKLDSSEMVFNNVSFTIKNQPILKDVNINIKKGLYVLRGPVNSGKSSFLKIILGEYQHAEGEVNIRGSISYSSQEPWLFPSTIKQNILFGEQYDPHRYRQAVRGCALLYDFQLLEDGDLTTVEDDGSNLSKGQKARISLARAVYRNRDIYLLDNCLSCLDPQVGRFVFEECIINFLKNKLVVLVTDDIVHVRKSYNVITMKDRCLALKFQEKEIEKQVDHLFWPEITEVGRIDRRDKKQDETANDQTSLIGKSTKQIYKELSKSGKVSRAVYKNYIHCGGGYCRFLLVLSFFVAFQTNNVFMVRLKSRWANLEQKILYYNSTNVTEVETLSEKSNSLMMLWGGLAVMNSLFNIIRIIGLVLLNRRASIVLHRNMLISILNGPMQFFDGHTIGSILNRFSRDFCVVDEMLPLNWFYLLTKFFTAAGVFVLMISTNYLFLLPSGVFFGILVILRNYYNRTARNLRRVEAIAKSPVVGYLNAIAKGLPTIRSFNMQTALVQEFDHHQDAYTSASFTVQCCAVAFSFCLNILTVFLVAVVLWIFLITGRNEDSSVSVGLVLSETIMLTSTVQEVIYHWAELENKMTSVERILEYTNYQPEAKSNDLKMEWPKKGEIRFEKVSLRYANNTEKTLTDVDFSVSAGEKVGIVGRTGAGKTSIISSLFRLYDVEGQISIDGANIDTLSPEFLRSRITIIPQEAFVFNGTVRDNIDPLHNYTDEDIWSAIEAVKLKNKISSLDSRITNKGTNFSAGEKQLICLVRAILSRNKIVILDEAAANLDEECGKLVQENFSSSTVVTITHKLSSVLGCDKLLVLSRGEIIERGKPGNLLRDEKSCFYRMAQSAELAA